MDILYPQVAGEPRGIANPAFSAESGSLGRFSAFVTKIVPDISGHGLKNLCVWHIADHYATIFRRKAHVNCDRNCPFAYEIDIAGTPEGVPDFGFGCGMIAIKVF
jgi:hypothetical protein